MKLVKSNIVLKVFFYNSKIEWIRPKYVKMTKKASHCITMVTVMKSMCAIDCVY